VTNWTHGEKVRGIMYDTKKPRGKGRKKKGGGQLRFPLET